MILEKVFIVTVLVATAFAVKLNQKTTDGQDCLSDCSTYKGFWREYKYCHVSATHWGYCNPTDDPVELLYPSSKKGQMCTSKCGKFEKDYEWCWTSADKSSWEYCSTTKYVSSNGHQCSDCYAYGNGDTYYCTYNSWFYDTCSPRPIKVTANNEINKLIKDSLKCVEQDEERLVRRGKDIPHANGVYNMIIGITALFLKTLMDYAERRVTNYVQPNSVVRYVTMPAPPRHGLDDVDLPLAVEAEIRSEHLVSYSNRLKIPPFIRTQMRNMDAVTGRTDGFNDDQGHLIASAFGGPNLAFNFVPMSPRTNRRLRRESDWRTNERRIQNHIQNGGRVTYTIVVSYGNLLESRRPVGFSVGVSFFRADGSLERETGTMYFTNTPDAHTELDRDIGFCPAPQKESK